MSTDFVINAETRTVQGKGASRRLRREGKVPVVMYGGHQDPVMLQVAHNELHHHLENEAFYSHILTVNVDGKEENAVLRDLQRHPAKPRILHIDLLRVVAGEAITMNVPLHFIGEKVAPGVKNEGGIVEHQLTDVEVVCLPKNLPEYIEVDVSTLELDESIHLEEITLPEGVELTALQQGENPTVAAIHLPRAAVEPTEEEDEDQPAADEVEATAQGKSDDEAAAKDD